MIYGGENEQQSDHLLAQLSQVVIYPFIYLLQLQEWYLRCPRDLKG